MGLRGKEEETERCRGVVAIGNGGTVDLRK